MCLDEDASLFSFSSPRPCPSRATDDFHVDLIQVHIARINSLVEDMSAAVNAYLYLISWDNRALTSLSLLIFVAISLTINAEYFGRYALGLLEMFLLQFFVIFLVTYVDMLRYCAFDKACQSLLFW